MPQQEMYICDECGKEYHYESPDGLCDDCWERQAHVDSKIEAEQLQGRMEKEKE